MKVIEFFPNEGTSAKVSAMLHEPEREMNNKNAVFPSVVVCPGGGYTNVVSRTGELASTEWYSAGYNVFFLDYSVGEFAANLTPLKEISSTVMKIRENASEWACDPNKVACCGFSAGGHLCACLATMWNDEYFLKNFDNKGGLNKPNAVVLNFAAYTDVEFDDASPIMKIDGMSIEDAKKYYSTEKKVSKDTPPTFMWHSISDPIVKITSAIKFLNKLQDNNILYESHILPDSGHTVAYNSNDNTTRASRSRNMWHTLSVNFLDRLFENKF